MAKAEKTVNVLFVDAGNSARSIMAESILKRLGQGRFKAYSAGSKAKGEINPLAIELLEKLNYKTEELKSKNWKDFTKKSAPEMDFIFTVCDVAAKDQSPGFPGQPLTAHWPVPDPATAADDAKTSAEKHHAFNEAYRMLHQRIDIFVNLPMSSLDHLKLQQRLREIGEN